MGGERAAQQARSAGSIRARGLFVTGTDTGVGKTVLSASLLAAIVASGERARAYKPVVTGIEEHGTEAPEPTGDGAASARPEREEGSGGWPWPADHELLAEICGMRAEDVSPLRYGPAVSPHLAAELAGERIDRAAILATARRIAESAAQEQAVLVVEGVGGLLVPLAADLSVRRLVVELALPLLIAARPGLGTINHTLLTIEAARACGLDVRAVVLTPWPAQPSALELSNRATIARLGEVEVTTLAHVRAPSALAGAGAILPWRRWLEA